MRNAVTSGTPSPRAATDGSDAQASSGMVAFGDTLLYVAVFGGAALFVLRILVAPLLVFAFLVSALLSPYRYPRLAFVGPTLMEGAVSPYGALVWFLPWLSYKPSTIRSDRHCEAPRLGLMRPER